MKYNYTRIVMLLVAALFASPAFAQDWVKMMQDYNSNFYETQDAFYRYYNMAERKLEREKKRLERKTGQPVAEGQLEVGGFEMFKRWEWFMKPRVGPNGERFAPNAVYNAMKEYDKGYQVQAGNWTSLEPNGPSGIPGIGRINAIRVNPTNAQNIFICAPSGGLWESNDDGVTWSTVTDQHQVIGCSDVAFDPNNSNIMYLATGDNDGGDNYSVGLLKSTDGGTTWGTTGLTFNLSGFVQIAKVLVDPTNSNKVLVATSTGLYYSTNAGATFTKGNNTATPGVAVAGAFKDMEFKPGTPSTVYACGTEFFKSTDGGVTWTKATGSLPAATLVQRMAIAVSAADPTAVYCVVMKATTYDMEGVYKSTTSGTSFPAKLSSPNIGNQGFYDLAIAANPTNANEVILGGQTVFVKNTTGGSGAWNSIIGTMHVDFHDVIYTSATTLYATSDGGVWKSTNGGSSWSNKSDGLTISQLYGFGQSATNANLILGGWQDNGTNYYNGSGWGNAMGGDGMLAFISKGNDNVMWGSQYNGTLNRSTSGVGGFSMMSGPTVSATEVCPWVTEWNEDPVAFGTVYAGCSNVWKATAGSFTKLGNVAGTSTVAITAIGVSPANTQIMWTAKGGTLYKSTNGGTSWAAVSGGLPNGSISDIQCHPTDVNKCWVTFSGFSNVNKVFQTNNQGTSWTNISGSLPNIPVNCITIDKNGNDALYLGTDAGVFFKDATMSVWQPFSSGLPRVVVSQLDMFYPTNKLRASTYGRGVWESTLYQAGSYPPDANFAGNVLIGCPGLGVQFSDYSAGQPTSWSWTFQGGNPSTSTQQNPFVAYNTPGTYSVSLTATNANGTDTQTMTSYITIATAQASPTPAASSYTICGPANVNLSATASVPGTVRWWNAPAGGTLLGSDNTSPYSISPSLSGTQTVYVDETFGAGNIDFVGASDNLMGVGAVFTANDIRGLYFDVFKPVTINNVKVYSASAGVRTIEILDANGNLVTDTTLNIANSGTVTPTTVTINRTVYPGTNYMIKFRGTVDCFRNSAGAAYPYTDGGSNSLTITNSNAGSPGYYYFFYDWQITPLVCNTARVPISIVDTCTVIGVDELFVQNHIQVFPNPNNGQFSVAFTVTKVDDYTLKVTNTIGQTIYEEKLNGFSGTYSKDIDIMSAGNGVYMLSVSNSQNEVVKKVLVH